MLATFLAAAAFNAVATVPRALTSTVAEPAALRLVVVATVGSPHQPHGQDAEAAAREAIVEVNRRGGVLGRRIHLSVRTDDCTTTSAEAIARDIVAVAGPERADAVIGHLCSGAAMAASRLYAEAGILAISSGARHPRFTERRPSPLVLRLAPRDDRLGEDMAALVMRRFPGQRLAIVHDKSLQATTLTAALEAALGQAGVRLVLREPYTHGEKTYDALADKLVAAQAQVVILPAQPVEAHVLLRRLVTALPQAHVIAGQAVASPEIDALGKLMGSRFLLMLPWLSHPPSSPQQPAERSGVWLATHAAIEAWISAIQRAGSAEPLAVVRALETDVVQTVAGPIRFDTRGDAAIRSFSPWIWREGAWRLQDD